MDRTELRPSAQDLAEGDPHLPEFLRYIDRLLEGSDIERVAHNASLLYLALVTGFSKNRLLDVSWVPSMTIDVGHREFEIIVDNAVEHSDIGDAMGSRSRMTANSTASARQAPNKALLLLDALDLRERWELGSTPHTTSRSMPMPMSIDSPGLPPSIALSSITPAALSVEGNMLHRLEQLAQLDRKANNLSAAINMVYWKLGASYNEFARSSFQLGKSSHRRTEQAIVFERLCALPEFGPISATALERANLKKRLQRSRKFDLIVQIFGPNILQAVPEISVSRIDGVRLEDLLALSSGSMEGVRVKRILQKMVSDHVEA